MKKALCVLLSSVLTLSAASFAFAGGFTAGTYVGKGQGNNGEVSVSVTFDEEKIVDVEVTEHSETAGISDPAIEQIPGKIVEGQSLSVDMVAGASNTSKAILEAVADAVAQAGGDVEALSAEVAEDVEKAEEEEECDVLVIGGGMAGLTAALQAVQNGAKVTLIEKNAMTGGTLALAGGYLISCDAKLFDDDEVADTLDDFRAAWEAHMAYSGVDSGYPDWERWESVVGETGETVDWLFESGLSFEKEPSLIFDNGAYPTAHHEGGGAGLATELTDMLKEKGVDVRTSTKGLELLTNDNGMVVGAKAEAEDAIITFHAKAVILATGGISQNDELVAEYSPKIAKAGVVSAAASGSTGDGFVMAQAVGADIFDSFFSALWDAKVAPAVSAAIDASALKTAAQLGVNALGKRFAAEASAAAPYYVDALASDMIQDGNAPFFFIYDAAKEDVSAILEQGVEAGVICKADTIQELAGLMGVDAAAFQETFDAYNAMCEAGEDTEFGKAPENLVALTTAPFYAVPWTPTTFGSTGGVKTDEEQRVLDTDGNVISGLYAAGEMSNRYFYNENYILGGSLGLYATCGRRAGAAAVADLGL